MTDIRKRLRAFRDACEVGAHEHTEREIEAIAALVESKPCASESLREGEETPVHTMIALRRAAYREHNASLAAAGPGVVITCDMCECGMHTGMFSSPLCALYATLLAARRASSSTETTDTASNPEPHRCLSVECAQSHEGANRWLE